MFKSMRTSSPAPLSTVRSHIRRRLLIGYRMDPALAAGMLPAGFRPQVVDDSAVAGVCVLGLESIRPAWWPAALGLRAENAAHRMAVEWDDAGSVRTGVFIFRRHSSSLVPVLLGGRMFPGVHERARFTRREGDGRFAMTMAARGESLSVDVAVGDTWTSTLFPNIEAVSEFYRRGRVGWSLGRDGSPEAVELQADGWRIEPATLIGLESSFFDALPAGAAVFDHAVVMRDLDITMRR